jgi:hypothetical protein
MPRSDTTKPRSMSLGTPKMHFSGFSFIPCCRSFTKCWRKIGTSRQAHSKLKEAGLTRAMNPESVPVNFPETDKGIKIIR